MVNSTGVPFALQGGQKRKIHLLNEIVMVSLGQSIRSVAVGLLDQLRAPLRPDSGESTQGQGSEYGLLSQFSGLIASVNGLAPFGQNIREVELENGSTLRIDPRPVGKTIRGGFKAKFELVEAFGKQDFRVEFFYRREKVGFAEISIQMRKENRIGIVDYLEIDRRFRGNGFSIDALHEVNRFLKVSRVPGYLENNVLVLPGLEDSLVAISRIYERMGWRAVEGTNLMELPLK
jgi:hypothetical protein